MSSFKFKTKYHKETIFTARAKGNYFIEVSCKNSLGEEHCSEYSKEEAETHIKNGNWIVIPSERKPFKFTIGNDTSVFTATPHHSGWEVKNKTAMTTVTYFTENYVTHQLEFGTWKLASESVPTIEKSTSECKLNLIEDYCNTLNAHVSYVDGHYIVGLDGTGEHYDAADQEELFNLLDCLETLYLAKME